jgi:hypothetical protein
MKYEVVGTPRVQDEYSDERETTMVIDPVRNGQTGDVWVVVGVPGYLRGRSHAVRMFWNVCVRALLPPDHSAALLQSFSAKQYAEAAAGQSGAADELAALAGAGSTAAMHAQLSTHDDLPGDGRRRRNHSLDWPRPREGNDGSMPFGGDPGRGTGLQTPGPPGGPPPH